MKKLRTFDIYAIPLIFVSLAAVVLRSVALIFAFDVTDPSMHFTDKTVITIGNVIVIVSVITFLSYLIFGEKEQNFITRNDTAASYVPAGIMCIALLFMAANNLFEIVKLLINGGEHARLYTHHILGILSAVLAVLSAVSFFLSLFIEKKDNLCKSAFSLFIVLFLAFYTIQIYFNKEVHPTNSPNRLIDQLAYLGAALFFIFEARIPLGRAKWKGYTSFGFIATLLCFYSSIPSLVLYAVRDGYVLSESIFESILTLTIAIYSLFKVLQIRNMATDTECNIAKQVVLLASLREEEMEEHRQARTQASTAKEEESDTSDASNYTFDIPIIETKVEFSPDDPAFDPHTDS